LLISGVRDFITRNPHDLGWRGLRAKRCPEPFRRNARSAICPNTRPRPCSGECRRR
jgi:hypothetical protein